MNIFERVSCVSFSTCFNLFFSKWKVFRLYKICSFQIIQKLDRDTVGACDDDKEDVLHDYNYPNPLYDPELDAKLIEVGISDVIHETELWNPEIPYLSLQYLTEHEVAKLLWAVVA